MRNGSTNTTTLEKIAQVLNVPISYFFEDTSNGITQKVKGNKNQIGNGNVMIEQQINEIESLKEKIEHYKVLLEEKERTIQILMNK